MSDVIHFQTHKTKRGDGLYYVAWCGFATRLKQRCSEVWIATTCRKCIKQRDLFKKRYFGHE